MPRYLTILPFIPFVNRFYIVVFYIYVYRKMSLSKASEIMKSLAMAIVFIIPITAIWVILMRTVFMDDSTLKNIVGQAITYVWFVCFDNGLLFRMRRRYREEQE